MQSFFEPKWNPAFTNLQEEPTACWEHQQERQEAPKNVGYFLHLFHIMKKSQR